MKTENTMLAGFVERVQRTVAVARSERPLSELNRMIRDAPDRRAFGDAIASGFGLIAEIKTRSPSQGDMRAVNVADAPGAYTDSTIVHALSVLTNGPDFGMSIERLLDVKSASTKPVLRKEFMVDPYQLHEARAFGADAVLLMTQVLDSQALQRLFDTACDLDLEVLVECHSPDDISRCPAGTRIYGLNSRQMLTGRREYDAAKADRETTATRRDFTTDPSIFKNIEQLPSDVLKVAESGLRPDNLHLVTELGFNAALVGSDLLLHPDGVVAALKEFESVMINLLG